MFNNYEKTINAVGLSNEKIEEMRFLLYRNFLVANPDKGGNTAFSVANGQLDVYLKLKEKDDYGGFLEDCRKALVGCNIEYERGKDEKRKDVIVGIRHKWRAMYGVALQHRGEEIIMSSSCLNDLMTNSSTWRNDTNYEVTPKE